MYQHRYYIGLWEDIVIDRWNHLVSIIRLEHRRIWYSGTNYSTPTLQSLSEPRSSIIDCINTYHSWITFFLSSFGDLSPVGTLIVGTAMANCQHVVWNWQRLSTLTPAKITHAHLHCWVIHETKISEIFSMNWLECGVVALCIRTCYFYAYLTIVTAWANHFKCPRLQPIGSSF